MLTILSLLSRYWLQIIVASVLSGVAWHYQHLIKSNTKLESALELKQDELDQSQAIITKERQNAAEVALRAQKFYEQEARDNEELENLRACHADKSCWPRVRIKTSCPAVSGTAASTGTSEEITAELGEDAGRTALRLRGEMKETKRLIEGLQTELIARSHPDYCKTK